MHDESRLQFQRMLEDVPMGQGCSASRLRGALDVGHRRSRMQQFHFNAKHARRVCQVCLDAVFLFKRILHFFMYSRLNNVNGSDCDCPEPCRMVIFSANVMSRSKFNMYFPSAQVYMYYSSKMITVGSVHANTNAFMHTDITFVSGIRREAGIRFKSIRR